jgi:hypothetical protein
LYKSKLTAGLPVGAGRRPAANLTLGSWLPALQPPGGSSKIEIQISNATGQHQGHGQGHTSYYQDYTYIVVGVKFMSRPYHGHATS